MIFNLDNPFEIPAFQECVSRLIDTKGIVEIVLKKKQRSIPQNKYLHLLINYFAMEFGYSADEVKVDIFKRVCNREFFEKEIVNKRGQTVKVLRSSASLDSGEMTTAIERFRNWSSAVAKLYLPAPNENEFLRSIEQEMQRNIYR